MKNYKRIFLTLILLVSNISFSQSGNLDTTFGNQGKVNTIFGQYLSDVNSVVLQPDGKIITGNNVFNQGGYQQMGIARYSTEGILDTTFGEEGKMISSFSEFKMTLNSMVMQTDGKIVGGGYRTGSEIPISESILVRYNSNGTLDTSFGNNGLVFKSSKWINAVVLQPDGKIITAGISFDGSQRFQELMRYDAQGVLDSNFGNNGIVTTAIGERNFGYDVTLQSDGKIVAAGATSLTSSSNTDLVITRYLNNGALDTNFGTAGIVMFDIGDNDEAKAVKIQNDGKIIFIGAKRLIRLLINGQLDNGFGTNGMVQLNLFGGDIGLESDGKIIVVGSCENSQGYTDVGLTRYLSSGELDTPFGTNGMETTSLGESVRSGVRALKIQPDGKIVVGGAKSEAFYSSHPNSILLRYNFKSLANTDFNFQKKSFIAYPNPVNQSVNLKFNLNEGLALTIDLYDGTGRKIINLLNQKDFGIGEHSEELYLPDTLSRGIYFLNISNGKNFSNVKIVK